MTQTGRRNGLTELTTWRAKGDTKSSSWEETIPGTGVRWGATIRKTTLQERLWRAWWTPYWAQALWQRRLEASERHQEECYQQVLGGNPATPLSTGDARPEILCAVVGCPSCGRYDGRSSKGLLRWWREWSISSVRKSRELCMFSLEKRSLSRESHQWIWMLEGRVYRGWTGLFSAVLRTRCNRHKLKHRRYCLDIRKKFSRESDQAGCPMRLWHLLLLGDVQKLSAYSSGQATVGEAAWAEMLDQMTSSSPFLPQSSYDSVKKSQWPLPSLLRIQTGFPHAIMTNWWTGKINRAFVGHQVLTPATKGKKVLLKKVWDLTVWWISLG